MSLKDGFNYDISNEDYHADRQYASSSSLKMMLRNPREYHKVYVLNEGEKPVSAALDLGSYIHARILEPEVVENEFAVFSGAMKRGAAWKEFERENEGKIIITSSQKMQSDKLISNFYNSNIIIGNQKSEKEVPVASFFENGFAEQTLCGTLDGVKIKVRFDYRKEFETFGSINDIKTTSASLRSKEDAEMVCAKLEYDLSAALYVDLVEQHTGKPHDFFFCFISKADGDTRMFKASEQMLETGRAKYKKAIEMLKEARKTGVYYKNKIETIDSIDLNKLRKY